MFAAVSHALIAAWTALASPQATQSNHATIRVLVGPTVGDSTSDRWMGLEFRLTPGWHVYWRNPGDAGSPPSATWTLPVGWTFGDLEFPLPRRIDVPPLTAFGYLDRVVYPFRLRTSGAPNRDVGRVIGRVTWVVCEVACIAEEDSVHALVRPNDSGPTSDRDLVARAVAQLPLALRDEWRTEARAEGSTVALTVRGFDEIARPRADFFPAAAGVLEHSAKVLVAADADSLVLRLTRSQYASDFPDTLAGLLVVADSAGDGARSYDLRVPVERERPIAATGVAPYTLLVLALLSGVLVNVMPCVFPLLAVKALSFATTATARRERVTSAAAYTAGSVLSCVALGSVLLLGSARDSTSWGFQMQSPSFLGVVGLIAFVAALNLLGVFEVPSLLPSSVAGRVNRIGSHTGAFAAGAVAILVGAPCTAPFFGATLAGSLSGPTTVGLATLGAFGLGAALPVSAFMLSPALLRRLPKPGPWMQTTKQLLAFPLLVATAWLVWVAGIQTGPAGSAILLGALCGVAFAAWILGRWWTVSATALTRRMAFGAGIVVVAISAGKVASLRAVPNQSGTAAGPGLQWEPYSDQRLDSLRAAGHPVLVDFTAAWCLTCKVNELGALSSSRVTDEIRMRSVALLRADLTVADTALTRVLHALGAASVPTYAVYPARNGAPSLLPPLLTVGVVTDAVKRAVALSSGATAASP